MSAKKKVAPKKAPVKKRATTRVPLILDRPREGESNEAFAERFATEFAEAFADIGLAEVQRIRKEKGLPPLR